MKMNFSHNPKVIKFLTLHTFSKNCQHTFLKGNYCSFIWKQILTKTIDSYAKTALNMIEEVSKPYLINNPLKTVAGNKNSPKIAKFPNICPNFRQNKSKLKNQAPL